MKSLTLLLAGMLLSGAALAADEENALHQASETDIQQLQQACLQMADEDAVPAEERQEYLLTCVNDQLNEMGYQLLESLPEVN
ncbi:hypothetical protein [Shewanella algae]|uniref:hypothetical protein n=1 Tax=Shewanella algae TaxID=38313 RepID=UPI0031F47CFE